MNVNYTRDTTFSIQLQMSRSGNYL